MKVRTLSSLTFMTATPSQVTSPAVKGRAMPICPASYLESFRQRDSVVKKRDSLSSIKLSPLSAQLN